MSTDPTNQDQHARILIVEDDDSQAKILESTLTAAGFVVDTIDSGLAAVWKVREGDYDAVLVDYRLPDIDGLATARLLGDLMGQAARPVLIALTAAPDDVNDRERGAQSAFDVVLGKSADVAPLLAAIAHRLEAAPHKAARQAARSSLLLQDWTEYEMAPSRPGANGDDPGPVRMLIVEDDEDQLVLLRALFEAQGYVVETTGDGLEAVRRIRRGGYDVALVDYNLPELDGLAAGRLVRNLLRNAVRPVMIALTATPDRLRDTENATLSVFDEIIAKSSDLADLVASVDRNLKSAPNAAARHAAGSTRPVVEAA